MSVFTLYTTPLGGGGTFERRRAVAGGGELFFGAAKSEPGFHFAGNFLDVSFDHVSRAASRLSLEPGLHCVDADGQVDLGSFAMLADLALAATVRANLERAQRLATVSMNLELTGVPRTGRLEAAGEFHGFFSEGSGRLGQSRVVVTGAPQPEHGSSSCR